jgi:hypothetical protein
MSQRENERAATKTQPGRKATQTERELSDAELQTVAGGVKVSNPPPPGPTKP